MKLRTTLTALAFLMVVATAHAAEPPRSVTSTPAVRVPPIEAPGSLTCAVKGFACASGFNCTLNKTALGPSSNPQATIFHACTPASASTSCTNLCPTGWGPAGGMGPDGSYTCKPQAQLCSPSGGFPYPAGGGYYCGVELGG